MSGVARRCSFCSTDWPDKKIYKVCPECLEETSRLRDADPLEDDEAADRKLHAEFERFYERWDETKDPKRLVPSKADHRLYGKPSKPGVR